MRLNFSTLNSNYSLTVHGCPDVVPSENECAVRLSKALINSGLSLDGFSANLCRHGYARGAQDLGAFLRIKWGSPDLGWDAPGNKPTELNNKKGVIMFANIPSFSGQGHIDLWSNNTINSANGVGYWNATPIWFWKLE